MKISTLLLLFLIAEFCSAQTLLLEGNYKNENVYIQNSLSEYDTCISKILVNGTELKLEFSSAYEIALDTFHLNYGDPVKIEVFHKENCKPKVITPIVNPKSMFEIKKIWVDSLQNLNWIAVNEIHSLTYIVEQFCWNKWIPVAEAQGKGGTQEQEYSVKIIPVSGENRFRVKQITTSGPRVSTSVTYFNHEKEVQLESKTILKSIKFDRPARYELFDKSGNCIAKGYCDVIDCSSFKNGIYYLNYDNKTVKITKKKQ